MDIIYPCKAYHNQDSSYIVGAVAGKTTMGVTFVIGSLCIFSFTCFVRFFDDGIDEISWI